MIGFVLLSCVQPTTVQPLVDVRASEISDDAAPGIRLAVAAGSLGAWLCSLDQTDLQVMGQDPDTGSSTPTIDAPADFAANLGVSEAGSFFYNNETGVASMSFTGSLDSVQAVTVDVAIGIPTREFTVSYRDPGGSTFVADADVEVEDCSVAPRVSVGLDLEDGNSEIRVVLPDNDGELLAWNSGQLAPRSGTASWSTGSGVDRRTWLSDDAGDLDGDQWPGTAASADWEASVTVSIARPD